VTQDRALAGQKRQVEATAGVLGLPDPYRIEELSLSDVETPRVRRRLRFQGY